MAARSRLLLLGLLVGYISFSHQLFAQQAKASKLDFSPLDRRIQGWIDSGYYNSASIVVLRENKILYQKMYGNTTIDSPVYIASAGKWLVAATIARLVDKGKLSWTDRVDKWIPEMKRAKGSATLSMLLSHTSGYPDYQPKGNHPDNYQSLKKSVENIIPLKADTLPGKKFLYGGLSMQVAGRMAELATGKDWGNIFQEELAIPLKMKSTGFTPVDPASGHNPKLGGGARSTLSDYQNFLSMIAANGMFDGKRMISEQGIKEMQSDQVKGAYVEKNNFVKNVRASNREDIYGLGEYREEVDLNGTATLISSPSWAGAYPWIDKKTNTYGFFLSHVKKQDKKFNAFLSSPVISYLVRKVLSASDPLVKKGYVNLKDARLYYEEKGIGEPLIFIHGHSFDRTMWDNQFYYFSKKYRVIRYDVRGYGWSSMPLENQTSLHADDLAGLMDHLKLKKAHIVGLSLGGFIACDFMALYPERIRSITAASGDFFKVNGPSTPWTEKELDLQSDKINAYCNQGIVPMKLRWYNALTMRKDTVVKTLSEPLWNMIYQWENWQPTHHEPRFLLGNDLEHKLRKVAVDFPVLSLKGEYDLDPEHKLKKTVPSAVELVIPGAGHVSNIENSVEFNRCLEGFLKSGTQSRSDKNH